MQFHPHQPLLLTCAGSRAHLRAPEIEFSSDEDSDSSSDGEDEEDEQRPAVHIRTGAKDARLSIWSFGQA